MKIDWTPQNLVIAACGIIGLLLIVPKLGDGLDAVGYLVGAPATAYAAKATAEEVEDNFDRYLTEQRAYTEALNKIVTQQQAPNQMAPEIRRPDPPRWWWVQDSEGNWYCQGPDSWWWPTNGQCE